MGENPGAIAAEVLNIFQHLHEHPEISWQEVETTTYVRDVLRRLGCRVTTFEDCTGVVGEIGEGDPVLGLRADLDALWQEVDGVFRANHSCGHDGHMSMVLGALMMLNNMPDRPAGRIRFIFQPAEEKGTGALRISQLGVLDELTYLFGVHLRPIQELSNGSASAAIIHGAGRFYSGKITGPDAHGARPHLAVNAIEVAAAIVHLLNGIHLDPTVPHSVKMTSLSAGGESANIIPGNARFSLDLRAQTNEVMLSLIDQVEGRIANLAESLGTDIDLVKTSEVIAAEPDPSAQRLLSSAITDVLGEANLRPPPRTPGGEDFHYFRCCKPGLKTTMLGLGCDLKPGLHHPQMTFDRNALFTGARILSRALVLTLETCHRNGVP